MYVVFNFTFFSKKINTFTTKQIDREKSLYFLVLLKLYLFSNGNAFRFPEYTFCCLLVFNGLYAHKCGSFLILKSNLPLIITVLLKTVQGNHRLKKKCKNLTLHFFSLIFCVRPICNRWRSYCLLQSYSCRFHCHFCVAKAFDPNLYLVFASWCY